MEPKIKTEPTEVLKKAIDQAVKQSGEFEIWDGLYCTGCDLHLDGDAYIDLRLEYNLKSTGERSDNRMWHYVEPEQVIFNHHFARAFWGDKELGWFSGYNEWSEIRPEDEHDDSDLTSLRMKEWQYHLQQMVLEKYPIKYLEKFLK